MKKFILLFLTLCSFAGTKAETIEIYCENLKYYDYAYMGSVYYEAENDDYFVSLGFFSDSMTGTFATDVMSSWDTFITDKRHDNKKLDPTSISCTAVADGSTYKVEGSMVCSDGNTYNFHLGYEEIDTEDIVIDLSTIEASKTFYDASCEWVLTAENDAYKVCLDFYGSSPAMNLHTSNFVHDNSYIVNKTTGATVHFSDIDYVGLRAGDYVYIEASITGSDRNRYALTMMVYDHVVDITGHASVDFAKATIDDQRADFGYYVVKASADDGTTLSLAVKSAEIAGSFRASDLEPSISWIEVGNVRSGFVSGGFTVEQQYNITNLKGEMLADDGIIYAFTATVTESSDEVGEYTIKFSNPAQADYNSYWDSTSIFVENDDYLLGLELYGSELEGEFSTDNKDFDLTYTYLIKQETGEKILPESIDAEFTAHGEIVEATVVYVGQNGSTYFIAFSIGANAGEDPDQPIVPAYVLRSVASDEVVDDYYFDYDDSYRLTTIAHKMDYADYSYSEDRLFYDARGLVIRDEGWQDLGEMLFVNKCEYQYDDADLLIGRDNFNIEYEGGEMKQSAHISYEYNSDRRLTKESMFWARDLENPFMICTYTYNPQGLLTRMQEMMEDWYVPGTFSTTGESVYDYDDQGRLVSEKYYWVDGSYKEMTDMQTYTYEGHDLRKWEVTNASGFVSARSVYSYDTDVMMSDVLVPSSIEYKLPRGAQMVHRPVLEEVWQIDMNTDKLVHVYDQRYSYDTPGADAIHTLEFRKDLRAQLFDNGRRLVFANAEPTTVRVVNSNGATVLTTLAYGSCDLSALPAGIYVISARNTHGASFHAKTIIR